MYNLVCNFSTFSVKYSCIELPPLIKNVCLVYSNWEINKIYCRSSVINIKFTCNVFYKCNGWHPVNFLVTCRVKEHSFY